MTVVVGSSPVVTGQNFLPDLKQVKFTSNNDSKVSLSLYIYIR